MSGEKTITSPMAVAPPWWAFLTSPEGLSQRYESLMLAFSHSDFLALVEYALSLNSEISSSNACPGAS